MSERIILLPVLLLSLISYSQKKESDTIVKVKLVKIEMEKFEPPPPSNFDLNCFNIFVLKNGDIYYYYDSTFIAKNKWDEYNLENLSESFLHKTSPQKLKGIIPSYRKTNNSKVILAVQDNDKKVVDMIFKEVFKPLKIKEAQVGYIDEELLEILQKIK